MLNYALRKFLAAAATLFFVALTTFIMARMIPGGPFDGERVLPPHTKELLERKYGFDKSPIVHFGIYFRNLVLEGDLGVSLKFIDRNVSSIILESFPTSLRLGFFSLLFALLLGMPLGILSAARPGTFWDFASVFVAVSGVTLPTFLVGALLVLCFTHGLGWLPPARLDTPLHYVLPILTLGTRPAGMVARMIRSSLMEQLKTDYVRTARAKGLSESRVLIRHALRNSLLPVITLLGPVSANIITGSFITEHFFAISGMAKHFIEAVTNRDIFLMVGVTLVFAAIVILINFIVDLIYPILDPRIDPR